MIIHCLNHSDKSQVLEQFIAACVVRQKPVKLVYAVEHLDIDTPGKDSYELFDAGLDFAMLVTDKQCYLKSRQDLSTLLPVSGAEWVIQIGEVYPPAVVLTVTDSSVVVNDDRQFAINEFNALISYLEECHAKRR
ncbi:MAG: hypothetical protein CR977_01120 [Gammaproteobacteria bacterium]|nr:MAG: hypothetical protein CR977_01120 [Gammaproteobacteria bacterium]